MLSDKRDKAKDRKYGVQVEGRAWTSQNMQGRERQAEIPGKSLEVLEGESNKTEAVIKTTESDGGVYTQL